VFGLLQVLGVVLHVHHQIAQERAQSAPILGSRWAPVGALLGGGHTVGL
jgi:hypothetical protein